MNEWAEFAIWIALLVALFGAIAFAIRVGYWIGFLDGSRAGFIEGKDFAQRKVLEQKHNDGYGSYH
jgi:hypothetical protein